MIKLTKKKMIMMTMGVIIVLFIAFSGGIFWGVATRSNNDTFLLLHEHAETVLMGAEPNVSQNDSFRLFFAVSTSNSDWAYNCENTIFSVEDVSNYVKTIIEKGATQGRLGAVLYVFDTDYETNTKIIIGVDRTIERNEYQTAFVFALAISGLCVSILYIIVTVFAHWIFTPVEQSFEKQKQFISDASHELKTPVTIIKASIDALRSANIDNTQQWINNIDDQTERMKVLVNDMLELAKLEEKDLRKESAELFDISSAINNCVLSFESIAYEEEKLYTYDIQNDLSYRGIQKDVTQLVNILIDNAIVHSDTKGDVAISLKQFDKRPVFEISNTGCKIEPWQKDKLFERFYRGDFARERKNGGSGLGLAIVKMLANKNKWKVEVEVDSQSTKITFKVIF